ncbi:FAD-dependent oxidoreductase, partial [Undibacterium sp. CCC2.1]
MTTRIDRDIVIIGAGASGLTAATSLRRAGLTVAVLEARDRVGGRLWTDDIEGATLEIGGQWVSPDQHALKETLAELGLQT